MARRILLPLAMPGVLVVATLAFVDGWNSFSLPLILMQRADAQSYTVVLQKYVQADVGINWNLLAAGSLLALIPVLIAFALLQRRDRKSTRLNSSHSQNSYAVFCLKKKKKTAIHGSLSVSVTT